MTAVIVEQEIDWAPFEALKDDRPCYDCAGSAKWLQRFACCCKDYPKCDLHKEWLVNELRRIQNCFVVKWHCSECGAKGKVSPGMKVWDLVIWTPL